MLNNTNAKIREKKIILMKLRCLCSIKGNEKKKSNPWNESIIEEKHAKKKLNLFQILKWNSISICRTILVGTRCAALTTPFWNTPLTTRTIKCVIHYIQLYVQCTHAHDCCSRSIDKHNFRYEISVFFFFMRTKRKTIEK